MNTKNQILFPFLLLPFLLGCNTTNEEPSPFSFDAVQEENSKTNGSRPNPKYFASHDGTRLAYYPYLPQEKESSVLIFIHGGGAHSMAGYSSFASEISQRGKAAVYLLDIRGHGLSEGKRGGTPTDKAVWKDIEAFTDFVRNQHSGLSLFIGGHSSGAGIVLNILSRGKLPELAGTIFLAPYFGYKANTERTDIETPFSKANIGIFVINSMSAGLLLGNSRAVDFNYPKEVIAQQPLLLTYITCNMSKAMTPWNPVKQFTKLDIPYAMYIGSEDEQFDPELVINYQYYTKKELRDKTRVKILEGENHLSIINASISYVLEFIKDHN